MTASTTIYSCAAQFFGNGTADWDTDQIQVALVTSNYSFNQTSHTQWADVSAFEVPAGFGYSSGGTTCAATVTRVGPLTTFGLADASWIATGGNIPSFRFAVGFANVTRNGVTNPLIFSGLCDVTPADIPQTLSGATVRIRINTNGIFTSP